jgi:hypothetical protein
VHPRMDAAPSNDGCTDLPLWMSRSTSSRLGDWTANGMFLKSGRKNVTDTGLIGVSDEEIDVRLRDPSTSDAEKKRLQKEQKARGTRNKKKRSGC